MGEAKGVRITDVPSHTSCQVTIIGRANIFGKKIIGPKSISSHTDDRISNNIKSH